MAALAVLAGTVKGGFFAQYSAVYAPIAGTRSPLRRRAAYALSRRGTLPLQEAMLTLNGAAAGSTAAKTIARVEANAELGGKRTIETQTLVNTATVAGDKTDIDADVLTFNSYDSTPVANLDGNAAVMGIAH